MICKIFIHLVLISTIISLSIGRRVFETCETSSDGSTWLLQGNPPNCYRAGEQGPCAEGEVLVPNDENSIFGVCRFTTKTALLHPPYHHNSRIKRENSDEFDTGDNDTAYRLTRVTSNRCPADEVYSYYQQRCIARPRRISLAI